MRIVHLLVSPRIGGAEQIVAGLNHQFSLLGFDSEVIYLDDSSKKSGRIKRLLSLRSKLRRMRSDVVLAHSFLPGIYSRLVAPKLTKVHYVLHSASDDYQRPHLQWIERCLLSRTASVIAVDENQLNVYKSHFRRPIRSTTITNGVSEKFLLNDPPRSKPHKVVTLARVVAQKRPEFWNEVAELAQAKGLDLQFEWWGPLSGDGKIDSHVLFNLPNNARYMGSTSEPEEVLRKSDIVFQSSNREASSLSVLEAAVAGKPQICSASIVIASDLQKSVIKYDENDPYAALDSIVAICSDWKEMSESAFNESKKIFEKVGIQDVAKRYLDWLSLPD